MKLVVVGATGYVGTEVIRLALRNKAITSVIALSRKPVNVPSHLGADADTSKLQTVDLQDWEKPYPDAVKGKLKGADACIWMLAVTPTKSKDRDFGEVTKVCLDYTKNGLENLAALASTDKPFRFIYTSGVAVERDQTKPLDVLSDYRLMRGRVENFIIDFAKLHEPNVEVAITRPGGIEGPGHPKTEQGSILFSKFGATPWIHVSELAAAMIELCVSGITKETLWSKDMQEIASKVLKMEDYVPGERF
ncbi:NAD(P)-binding protein [Periconia macrospinosa]|uniref:NAD(P)-binding protein n=1 Tax=Periconia macrospinosa TaxID=97972 RepID=A0A2V1E436_9PLEO|nr:NAD(P)-binding protein [Periconia macrospinosa]